MWEEIVEFFKIVGRLKKTERLGWITRVGIQNPESVAEHIFRTALISMVIADVKKLNSEKMIRMALIHDLAESLTGDFDRFAKKLFTVKELNEKEEGAMKKLLNTLPKNLSEKYEEIWKEFQKGESEEAKMVRQIDKLELLFQALEYEKEGYDKNKLEPFWRVTKNEKKIEDEDLKKIFELIEKERS